MRRRLSAALLSAVMLLMLWPTAAAAAEPDEFVNASELEYFEIPVVDPRFSKVETDPVLPPAEKGASSGADEIVDASELEYFELPVVDPRFPSADIFDNSEDDPDAVQRGDIHAVRTIDRWKLPQFAINYYNILEREAKPGGMLVDPSRAADTITYWTDAGAVEAYVLPIPYPGAAELHRLGFEFSSYKNFVNNCMTEAFYAFSQDHPEVFWVSNFWAENNENAGVYRLTLASVNGEVPEWDIRMEEYRNTSQLRNAIASLDRSATDIVNAVSGKSNYEKIVYFNEWLTTHNQYNYYVAYTDKPRDEISDAVNKAIGPLTTVDGQPGDGRTGGDGPVCGGYAYAFLLLCQKAEIPCVWVRNLPHAWNYVQPDPEDGRWYAVDTTWNDPPAKSGTPTLEEYLSWKDAETTAYTLVGADTIVYDGDDETFLEKHAHDKYTSGPVLTRYAYVDSVTVAGLDAPAAGRVPDRTVTLTSEPKSSHHPSQFGTVELFENPTVTWSPMPSNGVFAADTAYTATITYTPRRQGYRLMPADASRIKAAGADTVTVSAGGAIRVTFGSQSVHAKPEEFTRNLPGNLIYDGRSKTAEVRASVSSSVHNGYYTLVFTDQQQNQVTDLVKPGTYNVLARVSAHGQYTATEVSLGSVTVRETSGLHGKITISIENSPVQGNSGAAYVTSNTLIAVHATPDAGYQLDTLQVIRDDNGQTVPLSGSGNVYTFRMPAADVSIKAVFSIP